MITNIFITSLNTTDNGKRTHEGKLLEIYHKSDRRYKIVDNPDDAHIILIGNVDDKDGDKILTNPILQIYPTKCFSISDTDNTVFLNHGIYTSANTRSLLGWKRIRTGSYTLLADACVNPFIKEMSSNHTVNKEYLFSFIGRDCHPVRKMIFNLVFQRQDILIEDSSLTFDVWRKNNSEDQRRQHFAEVLAESKFSLCPRGAITNSIRLFESLQMGVAPIIISDGFLFPKGPDWRKFSIIIKEKNIDQLENIVSSYEKDFAEMGALAKRCYEDYFSEESYFNYVVDNCLQIKKNQLIPESLYWHSRHIYLAYVNFKEKLLENCLHWTG